ncbi:IS21 family transposase [Orbus wheelerorum]|uniref:IS21 family transposase n=1 Tax=Orbus wheelerorum TaxID=3074111 RepID=UPI00370DCA8E
MKRRTIKKHLTTVSPPMYQRKEQNHPKLGEFIPFLQMFLSQELNKPKREQLTVRRLYELLRSKGYQGQYNALTCFVRKFKEEYVPRIQDVYIPQLFPVADAYQFDWSTETVKLAGEVVKVSVAHFRLCHSRAFFIKAYPNQQMEMLVDTHNAAFEFLGGCCRRGIYDNMKTAVTSIGIGKERVFNEHFLAMMNHYLIEPVACTPASGWEKGQVERQVKTLRKRLFEPTLSFDDLNSLNHYLAKQCHELMNEFKHPDNKAMTVLAPFNLEKTKLIPIQPFYWYKMILAKKIDKCHLYDINKNHRRTYHGQKIQY